MDPFAFLIQMFAILAGLGVGVLVQGASRLVEERARVRFFWPHTAWIVALFVAHVASWFALWALRANPVWTLFEALCLLAVPVLLFFASSVVMPSFDGEARIDLEHHYLRTIRYSQASLQLALLANILVTYGLTEVLWSQTNAFRAAAIVLLLPGLLSVRPGLHWAQAVGVLVLLALLLSTSAGTIG